MKTKFTFMIILAAGTLAFNFINENQPRTPGVREILLQQFKTTHNDQQWFSTMNTAVAGLNADQAAWADETAQHSVGELAYHLAFWNERLLNDFLGIAQPEFKGENTETFDNFDQTQWQSLVKKLDKVSSDWEKTIEEADEAKLEKWYSNIANMNTHNAYHTGQIVYIRKLKGWWDPEKGVK